MEWFCGVNSTDANLSRIENECVIDAIICAPPVVFTVCATLILLCCCAINRPVRKILLRYPGHVVRWLTSLAIVAVGLAAVGEGILSEESYRRGGSQPRPHLYLSGTALLISGIMSIGYYHWLELWRRKLMAWPLLAFWIASIVTMAYRIRHFIATGMNDFQIARFSITIALLVLYSIMFITEIFFLTKTYSCGQDVDAIHPDLKKKDMNYLAKYSSLLSEVVFWWENWLFRKGFKKIIEVEDLGKIPDVHTSSYNHRRFKEVFMKQKEKCAKFGKLPSMFKVMWVTCGPSIALAGLLKIIGDLLGFIGPMAISGIVLFVANTYYRPEEAVTDVVFPHFVTVKEFFSNGYVLVSVVLITSLIRHTCDQFYQYLVAIEGLHARAAIQAMVYEKSMRLSTFAMSGGMMTMGQITNHMSVDANNVMMFFTMCNEIWAVPLKIVITLILLHTQLGAPALIAACLFLVTVPLQLKIGVTVAGYIKMVLRCADIRLKLSNEMLQGIKLLKLYGWEKVFYETIKQARENELAVLWKQYVIVSCNFMLNAATPLVVTVVAFCSYTAITKEPLTPDIAFSTLALFNQITAPLFLLPFVVNLFVNCIVSCKRLSAYFAAPEIEGGNQYDDDKGAKGQNGLGSDYGWRSFTESNQNDKNGTGVRYRQPGKKEFIIDNYAGDEDREPLLGSTDGSFYGSVESKTDMNTSFTEVIPDDVAVRITDGNFTWDPASTSQILHDINVDIPAGKLTMIVGAVGSGKSSLIQAILEEMTTITGSVQLNKDHHTVAFAAQKAWLVNSSLRENIVFGHPFRESRYQKVLDACALKSDIDMLPAGDETEIGEKGINLSGGQKQRVSVARALYSNRDIILLDDPLSALDVHVGAHLFQTGILKTLKKRKQTIVLVTHQLQYLPEADQIIVMKDGRVTSQGTPDEVAELDPVLCSDWTRAVQVMSETETESGAESDGVLKERTALKKQIARTTSTISSGSDAQANEKGRLIADEERDRGSVSYQIYLYYFRAVGYVMTAFILVTVVIRAAAQIGTNFWLSSWSEYDLNVTGTSSSKSSGYWIGGYAGLSVATIILTSFNIILVAFGALAASTNIHYTLLRNIICIPMRFFDTTPIGRILNRLSSDTQLIDQRLVHCLRLLVNLFANVFSALIVQIIVVWYFGVFIVPICLAFFGLLVYYISTSRELQRCESVSRSPIFAHFSETLGGLSTIRAYKEEGRFFDTIIDRINTNNTVFLYLLTSMRWVAVRLDFLGDIVVFISSLCVLLGAAYLGVDSSLVGLAISYSLEVSLYMNFAVRQCSEVELQMNGVERVKYYSEVPTEDYEGIEPSPDWPSRGKIEIMDLSVRYAEGLDPVLHDVTFTVEGMEKLGICGRTGSGKSSLTLALFRMIDTFQGSIVIDGIDIATVPLRTLRQRLSIIPQDSVLFTGSIRSNLDPTGTKTDREIWYALETAQLKDVVSNIPLGLDYTVTEGGENFSVGQRQLFCLARAFLRNSKIVVMDEATASIDHETDGIIQDVVADVFENQTVLTIAHRVGTILNSDTILTLKDGRIAEFDAPSNLLDRHDSIFASLVKAGK
ncbi:ATP-binding cassette sub-family C member 9-like [Diadema setosum]|uniref:ATP-binding cassette sub-family C member 9-like n=1 Tax=Diadema setosum TaxID=31175 RepID=UPI003B3B1C80